MATDAHNFSVWGFIKGFGKLLIGSLLVLQGILGLIVMLMIVGFIVAATSGPNKSTASIAVPDGSAILLNPAGELVEMAETPDPFSQVFANAYGVQQEDKAEVGQIIKVVREATKDKRIKALVLDLGALSVEQSSASKLHDVAAALDAFKASGKEIISVADFYSQEQYFLAARANTVFLNDYGNVVMTGYGAYGTFLKSFLDKIKVTPHVFRVGTFKAAVEPFLRDDMSPEAKVANLAYLNALWDQYAAGVEKARKLPAGSVKTYADNFNALLASANGDMALAAKNAKLVDELKPRREQIAYLVDKFGKGKDKDQLFKYVSWSDYYKHISKTPKAGPSVALVTAAGTITDGEARDGDSAGGDTIASYLKRAREDDDVKAVVLRVDSPGGSAFASEIIRQEVLALKKAGKPVVVSMGSLAASGGYWISAAADKIYSAPTTITGSIGIFGFFPTFERLASEWGVNTDGVGTTSLSPLMATGVGPLPEQGADIMQRTIENGYQRFLATVSEGRKLDPAYVDSIGQGRVWIGSTAKELKLVDEIGSLDDAIAEAAKLAKLDTYEVKPIREESTPFGAFFGNASATLAKISGAEDRQEKIRRSAVGKLLKQAEATFSFTGSFNDPNGAYARCVACEM